MIIERLKKRVYSPYSDHKSEWCVILGASGVAYPGVRIENISFPLSISSIHGAICSCLADGDRPAAYATDTDELELETYWADQFSMKRLESIPNSTSVYDPLIKDIKEPEQELEKLTHQAVIPHSDFPVAALLETENGFVPGVNVEFESWALGLCAERVALFRAVTHGYTEFNRLLITAPKGDFSSPCGACRQVLMEWMPRGSIKLHHGDGSHSTHYTSDLLPFAFSSSNLTD
jgi:homotetrameric cytidine deaminase